MLKLKVSLERSVSPITADFMSYVNLDSDAASFAEISRYKLTFHVGWPCHRTRWHELGDG